MPLFKTPIETFNVQGEALGEGEDYIFNDAGLKAFKQWWVTNNCSFMANVESGMRGLGLDSLANFQASKRAQAGCYTSNNTNFVASVGDIPFSGGQCSGTRYSVTASWTQSQPNFDGSTTNDVWGPVEGLFVIPNPNFSNSELLVLRGRASNGSPLEITLSSANNGRVFASFQVDNISVVSGPDDCGDGFEPEITWPPGVETPPPPSVGDVIVPKQLIEVDIDIGGVMTPITIEFGDVIFCGAEGSITTINGVNVKISPDGHHSVDFSEEANEAADQLLNDKLDEIKEELTREIAGMLLWNNCDGSELEQSYSGNGLLGISAQVDTVLSIVNEGVGEYCPLLGEDEFEGVFIEEVSVSDSPIATYSDVALPASARKFSVDVDGNTPSYAVAGSGVPTTEDVQGRFAVVSSGYVFDGGVRIVRTENQYYRGAMYDVATKAGSLSIARVSLRPGNTAKIRSFS